MAVSMLTTACGPVLLNKVNHAYLGIQTVGDQPAFFPLEQDVYQGYKVILTVHNPGDQPRQGKTIQPLPAQAHGITLEGLGIIRTIPAGQDITIELTPNRVGTFRVFDQLHPEVQSAELVVIRPVKPCPILAGGWCVG